MIGKKTGWGPARLRKDKPARKRWKLPARRKLSRRERAARERRWQRKTNEGYRQTLLALADDVTSREKALDALRVITQILSPDD